MLVAVEVVPDASKNTASGATPLLRLATSDSAIAGDGVDPKAAPTLAACAKVTLHGPVPLHAPLQPVKLAPGAAVAVRLTVEPTVNDAEQALPQLMPAGVEFTAPGPVTPTFSVALLTENVAATLLAASSVTLQSPLPLQAPPQPLKLKPAAGLAVNFTVVPVA
jgi:hypothetical protein